MATFLLRGCCDSLHTSSALATLVLFDVHCIACGWMVIDHRTRVHAALLCLNAKEASKHMHLAVLHIMLPCIPAAPSTHLDGAAQDIQAASALRLMQAPDFMRERGSYQSPFAEP